MSDFKTASLFGGAITADIPSTFEDVSAIRQVPDNQEVYLDREGFSSIVFDILERVEHTSSDGEALRYHLSDIVGDGEEGNGMRIWEERTEGVTLGRMRDVPVLTLFATSPPGEKQKGRANEPDFVGVLLVLVRLVEQKTDIVIAVNVPHLPGEYVKEDVDLEKGTWGRLLEVGRRVRDKVLETFEVKDWDLFVSD